MCGLPIILELFSNWICKTKVSSKIICMHPKYRQKRGSEREQVLGRVFDSIIACFTACLKNGRESYSQRRRSSRDRKLWLVAVQWTRNLMTIFVLAFDNVFLRSSICLLTPLSHPKHPWTVDFPVYGMCLSQQYKLINFNVKTNQLIRSKRRKRRRSKFVLHIPELIIQPNASLPVQEITTQRVTNWGSSTKTKWRGAKTEWRRDRFVNHPDK